MVWRGEIRMYSCLTVMSRVGLGKSLSAVRIQIIY